MSNNVAGGLPMHHTDHARIVLNVGGKVFETTHATLRRSPYFGKWLNSDRYCADTKEWFLDRDPEAFRAVLKVLRGNQTCDMDYLPDMRFFGIVDDDVVFEHSDEQQLPLPMGHDDIVHLNVGGRRFVASRAVLCQSDMFASMFSQKWAATEATKQNPFFIDQDGEAFELFLRIMRNCFYATSELVELLQKEHQEAIDYFGLKDCLLKATQKRRDVEGHKHIGPEARPSDRYVQAMGKNYDELTQHLQIDPFNAVHRRYVAFRTWFDVVDADRALQEICAMPKTYLIYWVPIVHGATVGERLRKVNRLNLFAGKRLIQSVWTDIEWWMLPHSKQSSAETTFKDPDCPYLPTRWYFHEPHTGFPFSAVDSSTPLRIVALDVEGNVVHGLKAMVRIAHAYGLDKQWDSIAFSTFTKCTHRLKDVPLQDTDQAVVNIDQIQGENCLYICFVVLADDGLPFEPQRFIQSVSLFDETTLVQQLPGWHMLKMGKMMCGWHMNDQSAIYSIHFGLNGDYDHQPNGNYCIGKQCKAVVAFDRQVSGKLVVWARCYRKILIGQGKMKLHKNWSS